MLNFLAFLDIHPINPGHTLVIPKKHYKWVWDVPNVGQYFEVARKIAIALKEVLKAESVVSFVIGEEVPHAHIWVVPRFKDDGLGEFSDSINIKDKKTIAEAEMKEIAEKLEKHLKK